MNKSEIDKMIMSRDSNTSAETVAVSCLTIAIVIVVLSMLFNQ